MDFARWLRYAIPGALFEALVVAWLYTDDAILGWYPHLPPIDTNLVAALTAASLPIGFALSTLMHDLKWLDRPRIIARMADEDILRKSESSLFEPGLDTPKQRGYLDAVLHVRFADSQVVVGRDRSLLDLVNGMSTCLLAVGGALVGIAGILIVKVAVMDDIPKHNAGHWVFSAAYVVGCFACIVLFNRGQWRTAKIAEEYLNGIFQEQRDIQSRGTERTNQDSSQVISEP